MRKNTPDYVKDLAAKELRKNMTEAERKSPRPIVGEGWVRVKKWKRKKKYYYLYL